MERALKLSFSSVRASPTATSADKAAQYMSGRSLLNDALSPSGRRILQDFLDDDKCDANGHVRTNGSSPAAQHQSHPQIYLQQLPRSAAASPSSHAQHTAGRQSLTSIDVTSRLSMNGLFSTHNNPQSNGSAESFVQIQCNTRPFCLKLAEQRSEMVVTGFVPDLRSGVQRGVVERSGLVLPGDVLIAVNDEVDALTNVQTTVNALMDAQLPAVLTFRRMPIVKGRLGEYTTTEIERNLTLRGSALLESHTAAHAALLVRAMIDVLEAASATTPLMAFVARVESMLALPLSSAVRDERSRDAQLERLQQLMQAIHRVVEAQHKELVRKWTSDKSSHFKRIEVMGKQRASIDKKLEAMRANPALLNPDNHAPWQEYVELRHLSHQLRDSVERAKREYYLPDLERYSLRVGSDGVYVGVGDIWIPSFYAKFTLETRASAPHVFMHLSTPATHGLKLRAKNFTLSTEGRLPSFHCDELNLEAQLIADVPLEHDAIHGWRVPPDELHVQLLSLNYYERQASSTKRGQNHDTIMKMLINRLLPSIVRHAAQNLLCVELGSLLESRNAQVVLAGEIKIQGKKLALYDAALHTVASGGASSSAKDRELAAEAREMMGVSVETAMTLDAVFRALTDVAPVKKRAFTFSPTTEPKRLSIRSLQNYFEQFDAFPQHKALTTELWSHAMVLLGRNASDGTGSRVSMHESSALPSTSFAAIAESLELLNEYPVDVSVTLLDLTFRLDLCEGAATYYTSLQRILRQEMDSVSVGLANLDSMRDGTFLANQLAKLDEQYEKINRVLAYITTNVDDFGAMFRGSMPAGFRSNLALDATDVTCKGPCGGTFTIPLTDLAQLQRGELAVEPRRESSAAAGKRSATALTHEDGALVFSKFFLPSLSPLSPPPRHGQNGEELVGDDAISSSSHISDKDAGESHRSDNAVAGLPTNRLQVRVKNSSARVLFELPTDRSRLDKSTFVPFAFALETSDGDEPPRLRVETGEFAKCQYKAEQVAVSGSAWQFVERTKESAGRVLQAADGGTGASSIDSSSSDGADEIPEDASSVWTDYADSPFLRLQFLFFTSCQVTREHMFWSIKSASLSEPKVAQLKHRVCLVELLQDVGAGSRKNSSESAVRRREQTTRRRRRAAEAEKSLRDRRDSIASGLSDRETFFSHTSFAESTDDFDRMSESMRSTGDAESSYGHGDGDYDNTDELTSFNGIEAFEEENSGDEDDSDEDDSDDDDKSDDDTGSSHIRTSVVTTVPALAQTRAAPRSGSSSSSITGGESEAPSDNDGETSKSEPEAAQEVWGRQFEREVSELAAASDIPSKMSPAAVATAAAPVSTLHKQTSVFF